MKLVVIDVWIERNTLVANIWMKGKSGDVAMFDIQRPIKFWESLLDKEALTGLYLFELVAKHGGVMK